MACSHGCWPQFLIGTELSIELLECSNDMAAGFLQNERSKAGWVQACRGQLQHLLCLNLTCYPPSFCHMLFLKNRSLRPTHTQREGRSHQMTRGLVLRLPHYCTIGHLFCNTVCIFKIHCGPEVLT